MRYKTAALQGMAVLVGGLIATGAMAQTQMASAVPAPQRNVVVFANKGGHLSPTAASAVRNVADAGVSRVTLVGRPENVAPVKAELVRHGVSAQAIVVEHANAGLPRPSDGLSDPADRRVEIKL